MTMFFRMAVFVITKCLSKARPMTLLFPAVRFPSLYCLALSCLQVLSAFCINGEIRCFLYSILLSGWAVGRYDTITAVTASHTRGRLHPFRCLVPTMLFCRGLEELHSAPDVASELCGVGRSGLACAGTVASVFLEGQRSGRGENLVWLQCRLPLSLCSDWLACCSTSACATRLLGLLLSSVRQGLHWPY